jgi:AraC-like DNA-binding protein
MICVANGVVRNQWSFEVALACQRFVGGVLDPEPEHLTQAVEALAGSLPVPESQAEAFILRDRLRTAMHCAAHQFHAEFHRLIPYACEYRHSTGGERLNWDDFDVDPGHLLRQWASDYLDEFARSHTWSAPLTAARLIRHSFEKPLNLGRLARTVGCARSGLIRCFNDTFGMSMGDYHARCRIRPTLAMLREPDSNVGAAAFQVGYHSTKNFYRALRKLTGMTPSQVRQISHERVDHLLDTVLRLPSAAVCQVPT